MYDETAHAYVFLKKSQTGIKYTPANGRTTIANPTKTNSYFNVNLKKQTTFYLYFALSLDYSAQLLYYYKNGVLMSVENATGATSNDDLLLGTCQGWCSKDFTGNIYAFKWSDSFKTGTYFKNV